MLFRSHKKASVSWSYFLFFSVHFRFFSPLFVTDMSPIVKEYRRILLRITTVFFFGFRKSSRYFLSAVLKIFLSLLFFLCCFYFYCFCCLCRTIGFLFHCHDTVIVFHSFFQSFFVGVCAFRSFFQHCDPLIAAIFLCGTI